MAPAGGIRGGAERATRLAAAPGDQKAALLAEIARRYHAASGTPAGAQIQPGEAGPAELWRTIRDEVLFQHEYLGHLPPQVRALLRRGIRGRELSPRDYDQLFRIAKKIERLPPEQAADYAAKIKATTADLDVFEQAIERYTAEMAARGQQTAAREELQLELLGLEAVYEKYRLYKDQPMRVPMESIKNISKARDIWIDQNRNWISTEATF